MSAALDCSKAEKCDTSHFVLFYRCIAAMGLDKKLSPPTKRKPRCPHRHLCCWGHPVHCHPCCSSIEQKSMEDSMSIMGPCHEASVESLEETLETLEESSEEETESASSQETEESQTDTSHSGTVFPNKSRG